MKLTVLENNCRFGSTNILGYVWTTKLGIKEAAVGLGAIVAFLSLYVGLVFLIACGAILALQVFGTNNIAGSVTVTASVILLIYGGYFLVTYLCSKSIIKGKR